MATFILRKVDPDLWAKFKARAASEGYTLKGLILQLIAKYIERGLPR